MPVHAFHATHAPSETSALNLPVPHGVHEDTEPLVVGSCPAGHALAHPPSNKCQPGEKGAPHSQLRSHDDVSGLLVRLEYHEGGKKWRMEVDLLFVPADDKPNEHCKQDPAVVVVHRRQLASAQARSSM